MIDDRGPGPRVQTGSVDEQMGSVSPSLHTPTRVDVGLTLHSAWIGPSETWDGRPYCSCCVRGQGEAYHILPQPRRAEI